VRKEHRKKSGKKGKEILRKQKKRVQPKKTFPGYDLYIPARRGCSVKKTSKGRALGKTKGKL